MCRATERRHEAKVAVSVALLASGKVNKAILYFCLELSLIDNIHMD